MKLEVIKNSLNELKVYTIGVCHNERDDVARDIYDTIIGKVCQILEIANEKNLPEEEIEEPFLKSEKFSKILKVKETSLEDILNEIPNGRGNIRARIQNCLHAERIDTLDKLLGFTSKDILKTPNFSLKSLDKLKEALKTHGYKLND